MKQDSVYCAVMLRRSRRSVFSANVFVGLQRPPGRPRFDERCSTLEWHGAFCKLDRDLRRIWCIFEIWRCCKLELRLDLHLSRTLSRPTCTWGPSEPSIRVSLCSLSVSQVLRGGPADAQIQHSARLQDPRAGESAGHVQHQVLREEGCSADQRRQAEQRQDS